MERMEVDQCAGAGGALRRSNSAPMITNVSDGMTVFGSNNSARYRRSSVSVNPSCPSRILPLSPFSLPCERSEHKRQNREPYRDSVPLMSAPFLLRIIGMIICLQDFIPRTAVSLQIPHPVQLEGGVESDGPPKKLFVAGVTDPAHVTSYTVSVSQSMDSSSGAAPVGSNTQASHLSVSHPPPFSSHHPSM
ncbi:hypothetical protein E1301_Tti000433 [Triplophysa tibetana]|uniref:Uncharacterized protein n=1 Tax=Triplophysa tibetana TaxID=1572043 RepID=A0A5A9N3I5_9TELE|nr:hypothetical protein E1301_Tti000433 [Triplophysa tibetana]